MLIIFGPGTEHNARSMTCSATWFQIKVKKWSYCNPNKKTLPLVDEMNIGVAIYMYEGGESTMPVQVVLANAAIAGRPRPQMYM